MMRRLAVSLLTVTIATTTSGAWAQQRPNAGTVLEPPKTLPPAPKELPAPQAPVSPSTVPSPSEVTLRVTGYRITGATLFPEKTLLALLQPTIGRTLNFAGLQQAVSRITSYYRERGYFLAQAYLPVQNITNGLVHIAVLEGRLGEIHLYVDKDVRLSGTTARHYFDSLTPGAPLRLQALERALLLLNDLPGVAIRSRLTPGTKAGTADLLVFVDRSADAVTFDTDADNWGNRFVGSYQLGVNADVNNPLRVGDVASARIMSSVGEGLRIGGVSYAIPLGYHGTHLAMAYTSLRYQLGKNFANLDAHGEAQAAQLSLSHPFVRQRLFSLYGQVDVGHKRLEDRVDTLSQVTDKKIGSWTSSLFGYRRDGWWRGGVTAFSAAYTHGDLNILTQSAKIEDASATGLHTEGSYGKVNYHLSEQRRLGRDWSVSVAVVGQEASKNLDSSEKFSLGGPTGVRAYPVGEAVADEGRIATLELRKSLPPIASSQETVAAFIDSGSARLNRTPLTSDGSNTRHLWGYGLGLRWQYERSVFLQTDIAWHGANKPALSDNDSSYRIWVRATARF